MSTLDAKDIRTRLVSAVRREIDAVLRPELDTAYARLSASWIGQALDYLLLADRSDEDGAGARAALLEVLPPGGAAPALTPDLGDPAGAIPLTAASLRRTGSTTPDATIHAVATLNARLLAEEASWTAARAGTAAARMAALEIDVTPDRLDAYFASNPALSGLRTTRIDRMTGGYSRDTFLVAAERPDGGTEEYAIRRDLPFGPVEGSAADEYGMLDRLRAHGLPVPRPIDAVRDAAILGQPFLLSERLPGRSASEAMAIDRETGERGARELAHILARLHAIDPREVGLPVADDPRAQVLDTIAYWRRQWDAHRLHDSDLLEAAFLWLEGHVPQDIPRSVIVHGDYRAENAMMADGHISGVLDWEFVHAGDAAEDVEYVKLFIRPFMDPAAFELEYLAAGGVATSAESAAFYEVYRSARNVVTCNVAWQGFLDGRYPSMRLSFQGTTARRFLSLHLAEALAKVTAA